MKPSLWEKQSFLTSDFLIIGAGITGLSAAASIKENLPKARVTVLERGALPSGASTKNAGFACFGSVSELLNDIYLLGEDGMVELVQMRWDGLQKTCQRLGRNNIDIQVKSGYELVERRDHPMLDEVDRLNKLLHPFFQTTVFANADEKINQFGFNNTSHLIQNHLEGQLDTGKLLFALWQYCAQLGIQIHTGCEVTNIEELDHEIHVNTTEAKFISSKVGVCTNAFTPKLLNDEVLDLGPGRGMVLSVKPSSPLLFEGTFHYDEGYYYFRDYYEKLLFGGGRNLALDDEETTEFGINNKIKSKLISDIERIILPNQNYEVEMEWSGIMAFGRDKKPIIKKVSDNLVLGVRLGGMGVAIGSLVGEEVSELLI